LGFFFRNRIIQKEIDEQRQEYEKAKGAKEEVYRKVRDSRK